MKKPLVMLHGFGTDSSIFKSIGTKLSKHYDISMVDLPGHGQTKELFTSFQFSAYTILHALEHYLKGSYHLLGWSMGGQIALEMYRLSKLSKCEHKDCDHDHSKIKSLTLISSTPKFVASDDFKIGMNKAVFNKFRKGITEKQEETMDDFYKLMFADNEDPKPYMAELKKQIPSSRTLLECLAGFDVFDGRSILPTITVPTLIIAGDEDKIIDPKASMYMSQEIKGSRKKVFNDTGHAAFLTKEAAVMEEINAFLG